MKKIGLLGVFLAISYTCFTQTGNQKLVGGGCDGCQLYVEDMPKKLSSQTTIAQEEQGVKINISGTIFKRNGKTPASNIILYFYHTDNDGYYKAAPNQTNAKRHGRLRGWIKTDEKGYYSFSTIRPASYPNTKMLAHIHPTIKEPNKNEYYIDDFVFSDDPFLTTKEKEKMQNRGGNGIVKLTKNKEEMWVGKRDIILGLNIPNYK